MYLHKLFRCYACLGSALALLVPAGCNRPKPTAPPPPPQVTVVTVQRTSVPVTTVLPGRTMPYLIAQVRARVDGIVLKRNFTEGTDVKANQSLYQIDPLPFRVLLQSAEASLQNAEAVLVAATLLEQRNKILVKGKAVSQQTYDDSLAAQREAAANVALGKANVATARINLAYTSVLSPITGWIGLSQVTQGAFVQAAAATLLTTIWQIDPIYVDVTQPSVAGLQLRRDASTGQIRLNGPDQIRATLLLEDGSQYPLAGYVRYNGITVDLATGSVTLRAVFPNPKYILLPGMFVRARVELGVNDKALLVPVPGVTHNPLGQASVLVVGADSKVVQRTVTTQGVTGTNWIVTGGLNQGERVIVDGIQKARPGMLVHAIEARPASTANPKSGPVSAPGAPTNAATATQAK